MLNWKLGRKKNPQSGASRKTIPGREQIDARLWSFIMAHWPLRLLMYAVAAAGIVNGAYGAVEKAIPPVLRGVHYVLGIAPASDELVVERNAFFGGMILRDLLAHGLDTPFGESRLYRLSRIYKVLGVPEPEWQHWSKLEPLALRMELIRSREQLEGHLEKMGQRHLEFFELGLGLNALLADVPLAEPQQIVQRNAEVLGTYARLKELAPYRLPALPLRQLKPTVESTMGYSTEAVESFLRLKKFLGAER